MSVFTSCKLTVPTIVDTDTSLTTDTGSDVTETDIATQADLSDENTETESVCATVTNSNTPTSELSEREVRVPHIWYLYEVWDGSIYIDIDIDIDWPLVFKKLVLWMEAQGIFVMDFHCVDIDFYLSLIVWSHVRHASLKPRSWGTLWSNRINDAGFQKFGMVQAKLVVKWVKVSGNWFYFSA